MLPSLPLPSFPSRSRHPKDFKPPNQPTPTQPIANCWFGSPHFFKGCRDSLGVIPKKISQTNLVPNHQQFPPLVDQPPKKHLGIHRHGDLTHRTHAFHRIIGGFQKSRQSYRIEPQRRVKRGNRASGVGC